jgi:hypothetical protein
MVSRYGDRPACVNAARRRKEPCVLSGVFTASKQTVRGFFGAPDAELRARLFILPQSSNAPTQRPALRFAVCLTCCFRVKKPI